MRYQLGLTGQEVWWTSKHREDSKMQGHGVSIEPTKRGEPTHKTSKKATRGYKQPNLMEVNFKP